MMLALLKGQEDSFRQKDLSQKLKFKTGMFVPGGHIAVTGSSQLNGCINNNQGWIKTQGRVAS
jgi:hypothetical protein